MKRFREREREREEEEEEEDEEEEEEETESKSDGMKMGKYEKTQSIQTMISYVVWTICQR